VSHGGEAAVDIHIFARRVRTSPLVEGVIVLDGDSSRPPTGSNHSSKPHRRRRPKPFA